jgi:ATP-dependent Lon protease
MTQDNKTSLSKKMTPRNSKNKKKEEVQKKKKGESSDSDNDYVTSEDEEEQEMDEHEYKKFLQKIFPSKHLNKVVTAGEKIKKKLIKKDKKKVVEDEEEEEWEEVEEEEEDEHEENKGKKYNLRNKKNSNVKQEKVNKNIKSSRKQSKKKRVIEDSSEGEVEEDEEEEEYDSDSEVEEIDLRKKSRNSSGKFNIIFTIGNNGGEEYEEGYDEEWEDDDEYYSDEYDDEDTEDEDEDEDVSSSEDETEDEEDYEEELVISNKNKKKSKNENLQNNNSNEFMKQMKELYEKNKDDMVAKECIKICEENMKKIEKKNEKKQMKQKDKNSRIFRKIVKDKNTMNDYDFFNKLEIEDQKKIIKELREINKITRVEKPYRLTLLEADMPTLFKGAAMKKINSLRYMEPGSGEYYKIKNWVDTFMRIPFGKYNTLPVNIVDGIDKCHSFMEDAKNILDDAVYGLNDAKMQIMQMMGQLITNPASIGTAIAIQGPMGTGKTTLVKEGISKILNRPFSFIALGGATDSSFLEGHSYTYEGSTWGKIVQILVDSKCMNPVIYFDELDKISDTPKGEEIAGILTHLTDTSQNTQYHDKYFAEVDFDLSKCLFIFSYNDESKINPILRDRMYRIHTKGYDKKQKTIIANKHMLPKIREQVKFDENEIIIPEETLHHIMESYCGKEDGVRNMKRCLEIIHTKLNLYRLMKPDVNLFEESMTLKVEFPFTVEISIVDKLLKKTNEISPSLMGLYV